MHLLEDITEFRASFTYKFFAKFQHDYMQHCLMDEYPTYGHYANVTNGIYIFAYNGKYAYFTVKGKKKNFNRVVGTSF